MQWGRKEELKVFLKKWTWNANIILLNTVEQPFSNLDPNPVELSLRTKEITTKVLMCQYIKAYLLKPRPELYLILHSSYIKEMNWNSCAHPQTNSIIWGLLLPGSLSYNTIHCVHYATVMVWQGCQWEIFISLFVLLLSSCGVLQCARHYSQAEDMWRQNKTHIQRGGNKWSTSKFSKNLQS